MIATPYCSVSRKKEASDQNQTLSVNRVLPVDFTVKRNGPSCRRDETTCPHYTETDASNFSGLYYGPEKKCCCFNDLEKKSFSPAQEVEYIIPSSDKTFMAIECFKNTSDGKDLTIGDVRKALKGYFEIAIATSPAKMSPPVFKNIKPTNGPVVKPRQHVPGASLAH